MLFWPIAAILTLLVTFATVLPLFRREANAAPARALHDAAVYRAQLGELEHDRARGLIGEEEARTARAEIARRLLRASDGGAEARPARRSRASAAGLAGLAVALVLPVGTVLLYDRWGSPEMPDAPLVARDLAREVPPDVALLIAEVEKRLAAEPEDGEGWGAIAPVYLQLGEGAKAAHAFRRAIALRGASAQAVAGLGEALVQEAQGRVTPEAEAEFRRALALDPDWSPARFFLALGLSQDERVAEAEAAWSELLRTGPADAPWRPIAQAALADARAKLGDETPGPDAQAVADAAALSPVERDAMVRGMVDGLADRLQSAPNDVEGWKRLIRSHLVLGDEPAARAALGRAAAVFPPASVEGQDIARLARDLGLATATPGTP